MLIKSPMKEKVASNSRRKRYGSGNRKSYARSNSINGSKRNKRSRKKKDQISFPTIKPWKIILSAIILGIMGALYLNHVFATEQLLREVQQLEQEYNQAKRVHNDYKLTYEQMIGPAKIYEVAKEQGFINGGPAEKVIEVEK